MLIAIFQPYKRCVSRLHVVNAHMPRRERRSRLEGQKYRLDISFLLQEGVLSDADWDSLPSEVRG